MYNVKESFEQDYKIYELTDIETNSWVKVAPERGGIIFLMEYKAKNCCT